MTLVDVQNDRSVPVTVYVQYTRDEVELGVVGPVSTARLRVVDALAADGSLDFFVYPKGQPERETGTLDVHRAERPGI